MTGGGPYRHRSGSDLPLDYLPRRHPVRPMMITVAAIESDMCEALPEGLRPHAAALARLLVDAANGAQPEAQARLLAEPAFTAAFEALAGKQVGPVLSFGTGNQIGNV